MPKLLQHLSAEANEAFRSALLEADRQRRDEPLDRKVLADGTVDLSRAERHRDIAVVLLLLAIRKLRNCDLAADQRRKAGRLADALEAALHDPAKAAEALGIERRRGRPSKRSENQQKPTHWLQEIDVPILRAWGLDHLTARHIAKALRIASDHPYKAARALGIRRPRGRGTYRSLKKHLMLAHDVHVLRSFGLAVPPSKVDEGILARVARERHCDEDTVRRAWRKHRDYFDLLTRIDAYIASHPLDEAQKNSELSPPDSQARHV